MMMNRGSSSSPLNNPRGSHVRTRGHRTYNGQSRTLILNCLAVLPPHRLTPLALALEIGMAIKLWVSLRRWQPMAV